MNSLLTRLGVPLDIQAFFNITAVLSFSYGDELEHFGECFHRVPTTVNLWMAGEETASHVIVSNCVMEALAFMTVNRTHYPRWEKTAFVAIGNQLQNGHIDWIRQKFPGRQFTFVFGNDLLGHLTDIKLAAGLKQVSINIEHNGSKISIYKENTLRVFDEDKVSLNAFLLAFGVRAKIRTRKPVHTLTFLEQLKNDAYR